MKSNSPIVRLPGGAPVLAALLSFICLAGFPSVVIAADTTIAELMEQGVYSEETKGDLDAAMLLYQQVIVKADAGQALAAQALFRLATCLEKKKDPAKARKAFAKLVRDYPGQKELVSRAKEHLAMGPDLLPAPWVDGEEMLFNVNTNSGQKIGVARYTVTADQIDGRKIWRLGSHFATGAHQQWSRVEVEADSFKPIHCLSKYWPGLEAETVYAGGIANMKVKPLNAVQSYELSGTTYDFEEAIQLGRRMPLTVGSHGALKFFTNGRGGVVQVQITAETNETVTVPAGTFDCVRVGTNIHQTYWYSTDEHHYLVKFAARFGFVAELTAVRQRNQPAPERYVDPAGEFSCTVPAGWQLFPKEGMEQIRRSEITVYDDEAVGLTMVKVENLKTFDPPVPTSVRTYAEHQLDAWRENTKELKIRADSWKEMTVAGQPAWSVIVEYTKGNLHIVGRGIYAFVKGKAVEISTSTSPEDFEAFQPKFEAFAASYQGK